MGKETEIFTSQEIGTTIPKSMEAMAATLPPFWWLYQQGSEISKLSRKILAGLILEFPGIYMPIPITSSYVQPAVDYIHNAPNIEIRIEGIKNGDRGYKPNLVNLYYPPGTTITMPPDPLRRIPEECHFPGGLIVTVGFLQRDNALNGLSLQTFIPSTPENVSTIADLLSLTREGMDSFPSPEPFVIIDIQTHIKDLQNLKRGGKM